MYTEVLRDGIGVALSVEHAIHRKVLGTVRGNDVEERLVELPGTSDPHSSSTIGLKDEIANRRRQQEYERGEVVHSHGHPKTSKRRKQRLTREPCSERIPDAHKNEEVLA